MRTFHDIYVLSSIILLAVFVLHREGFGQMRTAPTNIDELFRKAGISKSNPGAMAADFSLRDVNGGAFNLSKYRGNLVFLNFWATWCGPCRQEMPSMERLYRELGGRGLALLAINKREGASHVRDFMKTYGLSFPALLDSDGRVSALYRVWGLPTTYLIDGSGRILAMNSGAKEWASREVVSALRSLLHDSGNSTGVTGSSIGTPVEPLPGVVHSKSSPGFIRAQQDVQSEILATVGRGEELIPIAKAASAGETWYMVKTKGGATGWIKESEVVGMSKPE